LNDWAKEMNMDAHRTNPMVHSSGTCEKNTNDESEKMDCSEPIMKKAKVTTDDDDVNMNNADSATNFQSVSKDHILNFPIPTDDGKACIVKVYYIKHKKQY
jgi:hypothetical protein